MQKHYRLQEFIDLRAAAREAAHHAVGVAMTKVADAADACEAEALKAVVRPKATKLTAKEQRAKQFDVRGKQGLIPCYAMKDLHIAPGMGSSSQLVAFGSVYCHCNSGDLHDQCSGQDAWKSESMSTVKADQQLLKEQVKQAQQSTEKLHRCTQSPAFAEDVDTLSTFGTFEH